MIGFWNLWQDVKESLGIKNKISAESNVRRIVKDYRGVKYIFTIKPNYDSNINLSFELTINVQHENGLRCYTNCYEENIQRNMVEFEKDARKNVDYLLDSPAQIQKVLNSFK